MPVILTGLFFYLHCAAFISVLPIKNLGGLPRLLFPSMVFFSLQAACLFLCLLACLHEVKEPALLSRHSKKVFATVVFLSLLFVPLIPLRLYSFTRFYLGTLTAEYEVAHLAYSHLVEHPDETIQVMVLDDKPSFYWAVHNHARNRGISNAMERMNFLKTDQVDREKGEGARPSFGVISSRSSRFSSQVSQSSLVFGFTPLRPHGYRHFPKTKSKALLEWMFGEAEPPWTMNRAKTGNGVAHVYLPADEG